MNITVISVHFGDPGKRAGWREGVVSRTDSGIGSLAVPLNYHLPNGNSTIIWKMGITPYIRSILRVSSMEIYLRPCLVTNKQKPAEIQLL